MKTAVYLPFLVAPLVIVLSRVTARRLWPRAAAWAITVAAVALAVSTTGALVVLASPLVGRVPVVAHLGRWQPAAVAVRSPVPWYVSAVALSALAWLAARVAQRACELAVQTVVLTRANRVLAVEGTGEIHVIDDPAPAAHALPGILPGRGRIIVTTAMLASLDAEERAAVIAHERAHLRHAHSWFAATMDLAQGLLPLLVSVRADQRLALERWADEEAGAVTGRPVMASALATAGLSVLAATPAVVLGMYTHDVPYRVAALLDIPRRKARAAWAIVMIAAFAAGAFVWATHDTERFFEAARLWHRR